MTNKQIIYQVGTTTDGLQVVAGLYRFRSTTGLPFENIFDILISNNIIPSWLHLLGEAVDDGVNIDKFMTELRMSIIDSYGKDYLKDIWDTLIWFSTQDRVKYA